jgi:hypothetical protein
MKTNNIFFILCALILMTTTTSCANKTAFQNPDSSESSSTDDSKPDDSKSDSKSDSKNGANDDKTYPLLWEATRKEGKKWTEYVFTLIHQQTPNLIQGAQDMDTFCPRYTFLTTDERVNLWGLLISAMVKYESGFEPTSRMQETTMGIDPVTHKPVYSEGLLQLSYQDVRVHPYCDEFNWTLDKYLNPKDPKKTILDPYKNLTCGIKILAHQLKSTNRITLSKGVYWSVIKLGGKYNRLKQIAALTKKMPGCMN